MKKLLLTLMLFVNCTWLMAQFHQNFDTPPNFGNDTMASSGNLTWSWNINSTYQVSAPNSWYGTYDTLGYCQTATNAFPTSGGAFVTLEFDQICKVDFIDLATVQVSVDGGINWTTLIDDGTANSNCIYLGSSPSFSNIGCFNESSYFDWAPGFPTVPTNTWWKHEKFDISNLTGGQPDVRVRFYVEDVSGEGMDGRYGWLIDNIDVRVEVCETNPPILSKPRPNLSGTIYSLNTIDVYDTITDASTILQANLNWYVNGNGPFLFPMLDVGNNEWVGQLSSDGAGSPFLDGDSICYWIDATDNSGCGNIGYYPAGTGGAGGCKSFKVSGGITFDFCDDFDANQLWIADTSLSTTTPAGSPWEQGPPTNTTWGLDIPHSAPNVIGVGINTPYVSGTRSDILSPVFDFSSTSIANLSFWISRDVEDNWDGVRLEFTTEVFDTTDNNGASAWTVIGTVNDPNGKNWYNEIDLGSSNEVAWDSTLTAWTKASYKLASVPGLCLAPTGVQFRFVFTSDGSFNNGGFLIDDFCIKIPPLNDVGIAAIVQPVNGTGQPAGSTPALTVTLENFGQNQQTAVDILYTICGQGPFTYSWTGTLPVGGATTFSITPITVSLSNGTCDIVVWSNLSGDGDLTNDTSKAVVTGIPTLTLTYCDDFESGNVGWVSTPLSAGTTWELGTPSYVNPPNIIPTIPHSGTNVWDINLASAYSDDANAELYTPYFDFGTVASASLKFFISYWTENSYDGVRLDYTTNGGLTWDALGTAFNDPCGKNWYDDDFIGNTNLPGWTGNSNGWKEVGYKLCCANNILLNPTPVQFRFVFTSDFIVNEEGASIDDFCIYQATGDDIGISAITAPAGGYPVGTSQPVVVTLENFGSTTITATDISYTVNNGSPVTFSWTGSLAPCASVQVTLAPFNIVQGPNDIVAYTQFPGTDINLLNDTSRASVIGQPLITPTYIDSYFDNFDAGNIGWAPIIGAGGDPGSNWEYGVPAYGATTLAHSIPLAWDINLTSASTTDALAYLYTPFFDLSQGIGSRISFWQNRAIDDFGDGLSIEYCLNSSGVWQLLQPTGTAIATNWYNNFDSWSGISNAGWEKSEIKGLDLTIGTPSNVQFRFVYLTGAFSAADGASIDDFEIFVPIPLSVTPVSVNLSNPNSLILPGQPITFAAPIKNNGINSVFGHQISLTIDGVPVVTNVAVPYSPQPLAPDSVKLYTFTGNTWTATPGHHTVCVYTSNPNGTTDLTLFDDTVCTQILVFDSVTTNALPYCNDFESGTEWVTLNGVTYAPKTSWELGLPNESVLNSAHSGDVAWTTYADSNYINRDSSGLFSSMLRVQTGHCYRLNFYQQFKMEYGSDGGTVDYSDDLGVSWKHIDFTGTPNVISTGVPGTNYTYVAALDPADPTERGFTGKSNGWIKAEKVLRPNVDGLIIVRWRFSSDFSVRDEGWSIDDFCFADMGVCAPVGIDEYAYNDFGMSQNYPNPSSDNTTIEYMIPQQGNVSIVVTDLMGQVVDVISEGNESAGTHKVEYNTSRLAAGMYTYTLRFNDQQMSKRMVITK